jgi:hypothetical protein
MSRAAVALMAAEPVQAGRGARVATGVAPVFSGADVGVDAQGVAVSDIDCGEQAGGS